MRKAVTIGDLAHARTRAFQERVRAALSVIEQATTIGKIGVSYSGGKDSTCTLDLVRRLCPDAPSAFFDSGCEYPGTYEMVRRYEATVIKPQMSLLEMCRYGGYWGYLKPEDPRAEFDFFGFLVAEPSERFVEMYDLGVIAMGLRGQESSGRRASARKRGELYQIKATGIWHLCPLAKWRTEDVWAYIASRDLPYNPAYDKMAAIGIPRDRWRVAMLLGLTTPGLEERYAWLRQVEPHIFYQLAAEFPKILEFT